jgi:hypothetical protein
LAAGSFEHDHGYGLGAARRLFDLELHQVPFIRQEGFLDEAGAVEEDLIA